MAPAIALVPAAHPVPPLGSAGRAPARPVPSDAAPAAPGPPGGDELAELIEQLRLLCGVPRPAPPLPRTVALAPASVPRPVGVRQRHAPAGVGFRRQLARLREFQAAHGRLPSSGRSGGDEERRLGMWLCRQRRRHRDGTGSRAEAAMLAQALGPGWESMRPPPTG